MTHLDTLLLLGSDVLDAKMISTLIELRKSIHWSVLTETTIGCAAYPWSSSISRLKVYAKEHMPNLSEYLILLPEIEEYLPDDIRKSLEDKK